MCLLNFTVEIMILKKIKNILEWILTKYTIFMDFFFLDKMCFIDSLKSCIILCAVGKL